MPVIINEFDLDIEPPERPAGGDGAPPPPQAPPLRPLDLRDALAHQLRRAERLRAH